MQNFDSNAVEQVKTYIEVSSVSETGPVREHNEDSIVVLQPSDHGVPNKGTVLVVADGMGGMDAGERASAMAIAEFPSCYLESEISDCAESMVRSVKETNRRVYEVAQTTPSGRRMGTTIVASVIVKDHLVTVNVGDSRSYIFRNGSLTQLSKDHTMRSEFFRLFDSKGPDLSHVLTQAIGPQPIIYPHVSVDRVLENDLVLLCSDGLTSAVPDEEIKKVLAGSPFTEIAQKLLAKVFENNGEDNVSIIVAKVSSTERS